MAEASNSTTVSTKQQRLAELARQSPPMGFTSLNHLLDRFWLHEAFCVTRANAAPGVDGQTAADYSANLGENLQSLLDRAKSGTYRASPVRRVHIPKGTGSETRPIGVPTFEDKVLQRAVVMALEPIYEQDFLDCSYGFRPGRSAHQALEVLRRQAMALGGCWLVEVDIRKFFVHLTEGFDFLGCHVRQYRCPKTTRTGYKCLIRPSKQSVDKVRQKLREAWWELKGQSLNAVLWRLNPLIRGWANYFRTQVSSRVFQKLDHGMYLRALRYVKHTHPHKSKDWRVKRYFGKLNPKRKDRWVFGDIRPHQDGRPRYLIQFSGHKIVRHVPVQGSHSPDDPGLREYGWSRRKVNTNRLSPSDVDLANDQDWVCPVCGVELLNGEPLERHHRIARSEDGTEWAGNRVLLHQYCHQQETAAWRKGRRRSGKES